MSKGEEQIESILRAATSDSKCKIIIAWEKEKTFPNLSYKGHLLRYDFAIYDTRGIVSLCEFDGVQHFDEVKFFKNFKHMKENDRRKNQYALDHNIPLYRIPYWEINNITSIEDIFNPKFRVRSKFHNDDLIWEYKKLK